MGDNWLEGFLRGAKGQIGSALAPIFLNMVIEAVKPKLTEIVVKLVEDGKAALSKKAVEAKATETELDDVGLAAAAANVPFVLEGVDGAIEFAQMWVAKKLEEAKATPGSADDIGYSIAAAVLEAIDSAVDAVRGNG